MLDSNNPLVSVLMTSYNREKYIAEAIESVLASTYTNFELIIVDDCSTDITVSIAKSFEEKDRRIKVHVNKENLQQFQNRNKSATLANGEFIFYVDSDDTVLPNGIERLVDVMKSFPESSFGMYWYEPESTEALEIQSKQVIHDHFFKTPILINGPGGTILKRSFFLNINGYPEKYDAAADMYFNLKACCHTSLVRIPFEFVNYRRHEGQAINTPQEYLYNNYLYLRDALKELPLPLKQEELDWIAKKNKRRFLVNLIRYFIKTKNVNLTKKALQITGYGFKDAFEGIFH